MKELSPRNQKQGNANSNSYRGQQSTAVQFQDEMKKMNNKKLDVLDQRNTCLSFSISDRLFQTYTEYFHRVLFRVNKPLWLAWVLVLLNYIQMQMMSFPYDLNLLEQQYINNYQFQTYLIRLQDILRYSHLIKILDITTQNDFDVSRHIVNVFSFFLNIQFLLFLLFALCLNLRKGRVGNLVMKSMLCFESVYLQLFGYILFIPSIYSAASTIFDNDDPNDYNPLYYSFAALSLLFSLIIGAIFHFHDFDYRFTLENHLSKRHSNWSYLKFISETAIIVLYCKGLDSWIINFLLLLQGLLNIGEFFLSLPFYSKRIQILYVSISLNKVFMSFFFLVCMRSKNMSSMLIVCVCVAPLCMILSGWMHHIKYSHILYLLISPEKNKNKVISAKWVDQFVRYMHYNFDYFYEDYMLKKSGVLYETIYISHLQSCTSLTCFCQTIQSNSQYDVSFLGDQIRKQFMDGYLMDLMEKYLNDQKIKDDNYFKLIYSYINFLIDVKQIPQKVNYELLKMKNSNLSNSINQFNKLSLQNSNSQQKKNQISSFVGCLLYEQMKERSEDKFKLFYSKEEFQNQRLKLELVIEFDDLLNKSHTYLQDIVYQQGEFYAFLSQDYLNIEQLEKKGNILRGRRDFFRQYIQRMFDINFSNETLLEIAVIYSQSLDFENRTIKNYMKNSKRILTSFFKKVDLGIDLFKNDSCVVKVSLLNQVGIMRQISTQFESLIGYSQKEIIGQNINLLIPQFFQKQSADYIYKFINSHELIYDFLCSKILTFPVTFQGFIIPMYMRLHIYQSDDDFGVCAYLEKHDQNKQYIIISEEGSILEISQSIFNCISSTDNSKCTQIINSIHTINITTTERLYGIINQSYLQIFNNFN